MKDGKRSFAKNSMIIGALSRFSDFLRNRFDESFFGWLLCGNYRHEENGIIGLAGEKLKIRQRITVPFKRFNARAFENSLILRKTGEMFRKIPDVQFKYAGIFVFAFGLYTAISCLIKNFGAAIAGQSFYTLYLGVICAAIGGIISTSQKRLSETVAGSRILSFLIFRVLGIKPAAVSGTGKNRGRGDVSFVSGIVLGLISEITSPFAALLAIPVSALAFAVLAVPECGAVCVILAFPFLGMRQLALLCAFVTAAWLLKLMRGKRTVSTSSLDIAVLAFAAVMLAGGLVSVTREESMRYALYFICFMSGYFIAVNLIRTSEWFYRCISALVFSFSLTVIAGTVSAVGSPGLAGIPFLQTAAQKLTGIVSVPSEFAQLTVLILPFLLVCASGYRKTDAGLGLSLLSVLSVFCLFFTRSRGGWGSAVIGLVVLLLLVSRRSVGFIAAAAVICPIVRVFLPPPVTAGISEFLSVSGESAAYRTGLWNGVDRLITQCFAGGIGVGETAFEKVFPLFSQTDISANPTTKNLYTQITVSVGVSGLIVFAAILLIFLRHFCSFYSAGHGDDRRMRLFSAAGFSGICAILVFGFTEYVLADYRVLLAFWLIIGLTSSAVRVSVRERIHVPEPEGISLDIDLKKLRRARNATKKDTDKS